MPVIPGRPHPSYLPPMPGCAILTRVPLHPPVARLASTPVLSCYADGARRPLLSGVAGGSRRSLWACGARGSLVAELALGSSEGVALRPRRATRTAAASTALGSGRLEVNPCACDVLLQLLVLSEQRGQARLELCDLPVVLVKVRGHRLQPRHLPLVLGLLLTLKHLDGILKGVGSLGACLPCDRWQKLAVHILNSCRWQRNSTPKICAGNRLCEMGFRLPVLAKSLANC
mmetsp:Transcript_32902/g.77528  ORF Transcript_32902/g.77528 Transcript_32902/m.77528 type:complete len:230 (-) Transcript_32902:146-835(-)